MKTKKGISIVLAAIAFSSALVGLFEFRPAASQQTPFEGKVLATCSIGLGGHSVGFDGTWLYYTDYYTGNGKTLYRVSPTPGAQAHVCPAAPSLVLQPGGPGECSPTAADLTNHGIITVISWDSLHNQWWAAGRDSWIYKIQTNGACSQAFQITSALLPGGLDSTICGSCTNLVDGINYDRSDDTIWYSPDGSTRLYHFSGAGSLVGFFDTPGFTPPCPNYQSGVAVGSDTIYLGAGECHYIFKYDKQGHKLGSFFLGTKKTEDMECDSVTFADQHTDAVWTRDTRPSDSTYGNLIAFAVPRGTCVNPGPAPSASNYTAKWICNIPDANGIVNTTAARSIGLVPGEYQTDINVHNPNPSYTFVKKEFVMSLAESPVVNTSRTVLTSTVLGPDDAMFITCAEILNLLQNPPTATPGNTGDPVDTTSISVSCSPSSVVVSQASTCMATVTDTAAGTVSTPTGSVSFSVTGVTGSFSGSVCTLVGGSTGSSSCSVTFTPSTTGTATITATYPGDANHNGSIGMTGITVNQSSSPDYSLTANPSIVGTNVGTTGTSRISVAPLNGFTGTVGLSTSVPAGISCSLSPSSVTGSGSSTLSCTPQSDGLFNVTVTGTSGSLSHSLIVTLAAPPPTINIVANPTSLLIPQGGCASKNITLSSDNFNGNVVLTTSSLGSGLTASFSPQNTVTLTSAHPTATVIKTVCASSTTPTGTYPETITATGTTPGATQQHPITATLTESDRVTTTSPPPLLTAKGFVILTSSASNLDVVAEYSAESYSTSPVTLRTDPRIRFVDANNNNVWDRGESVVYDTNGNGVYDAGEPVIAGSTPAAQTVLKFDPKIKFVDSNGNGVRDSGETVVYDSNNNGVYDTGEPIISGVVPLSTQTSTGISLNVQHIPAVASQVTSCSPEFVINANPTSLTIKKGGNFGTSNITLTGSCNYAANVSLSATISIGGTVTSGSAPTLSFSASMPPVTSGGTSFSILTVKTGTSTGAYTVIVTGTDGSISHSVSIQLNIV